MFTTYDSMVYSVEIGKQRQIVLILSIHYQLISIDSFRIDRRRDFEQNDYFYRD